MPRKPNPQLSYQVYGTKQGDLWMGGGATLDFDVRFVRHRPASALYPRLDTLADVFAHLTTDSNFQPGSCRLIAATLVITKKLDKRTYMERYYDLRDTRSFQHLLVEEGELVD